MASQYLTDWLIEFQFDRHETNHGMSQLVSDNDSFVFLVFVSFFSSLPTPTKSCRIHFTNEDCVETEWTAAPNTTQIKQCRFVFDLSHLTSIKYMLMPYLSTRIMNDCHQLTKCLLHPVRQRSFYFLLQTNPENFNHSLVQIDLSLFLFKN